MRCLIIGLGIYGSNLARDLTDMGNEVIGADNRKTNIDAIKDYISTVYQIDATEESALTLLPLNNVDLVIVAIGENFGASIKVVAMLKKLNVKHIYARAVDPIHESILQGFGVDRILTPEQRAARDLSDEMSIDSRVQSLTVDRDNFVLKFKAPRALVGERYSKLNFEKDYNLRLIAVTRAHTARNIIGMKSTDDRVIDHTADGVVVEDGDVIVCFGSRKSYNEMGSKIEFRL